MASSTSCVTSFSSERFLGLPTNVACSECQYMDPPPPLKDDLTTGEVICSLCGTVLQRNMIDPRAEWRTFDDDTVNPCRVGDSLHMLDKDASKMLSTDIGAGGFGTAFGSGGAAGAASIISRDLERSQRAATLKAQHAGSSSFAASSSSHARIEKQQKEVAARVAIVVEELKLSRRYCERARAFHKRVDPHKLKGKTVEAIVGALVYTTMREEQQYLPLKAICAVAQASRKDVNSVFKVLQPLMEKPVITPSDEDFLNKCCSSLLGKKLEKKVVKVVEKAVVFVYKKARELGCVTSKHPTSVVGAVLLLVTRLLAIDSIISVKEIADILRICDSTVKSVYKDLYPHRMVLSAAIPRFSPVVDPENLPPT